MTRALYTFSASLALVAVLAGCREEKPAPPPPEPIPGFLSDAQDESKAVFLRGDTDGARLVVDVVARGVADVHGLVYRLTYDPALLRFQEASTRDGWSKHPLAVAREGTPGQLAVTWTELGETAGFEAASDTILGTLVFEIRKEGVPARVDFRVEKSALVDHHAKPIAVTWFGGAIAPKQTPR